MKSLSRAHTFLATGVPVRYSLVLAKSRAAVHYTKKLAGWDAKEDRA